MSVYKCMNKPTPPHFQPLTVHWEPSMDVNYPPQKKSPVTWEIYSQQQITIQPKETKTMQLSFGVFMSNGLVVTSLKQELKYKRSSL